MLSNGFEVPLHLQLKKSKLYLGFLIGNHMLALLAISLPSSIPVLIKVVIAIAVFVHAVIQTRKYSQSFVQPPIWVWQKSGIWFELSRNDEAIWLCGTHHLITSWFVIVDLYNDENKHSLLIFKDQCSVDSFRRLRVRLKYYQEPVASPTDAG